MNQLTTCPKCGASLSNWEQKERECFTCQWSEYDCLNDTLPNMPPIFEYDREIDDETQD